MNNTEKRRLVELWEWNEDLINECRANENYYRIRNKEISTESCVLGIAHIKTKNKMEKLFPFLKSKEDREEV